jgi:hypothetical protein
MQWQQTCQQQTRQHAGQHLAMIRQFCRIGLTVLLAGGALAGIIALKTMVYFWRYNYY